MAIVAKTFKQGQHIRSEASLHINTVAPDCFLRAFPFEWAEAYRTSDDEGGSKVEFRMALQEDHD